MVWHLSCSCSSQMVRYIFPNQVIRHKACSVQQAFNDILIRLTPQLWTVSHLNQSWSFLHHSHRTAPHQGRGDSRSPEQIHTQIISGFLPGNHKRTTPLNLTCTSKEHKQLWLATCMCPVDEAHLYLPILPLLSESRVSRCRSDFSLM